MHLYDIAGLFSESICLRKEPITPILNKDNNIYIDQFSTQLTGKIGLRECKGTIRHCITLPIDAIQHKVGLDAMGYKGIYDPLYVNRG